MIQDAVSLLGKCDLHRLDTQLLGLTCTLGSVGDGHLGCIDFAEGVGEVVESSLTRRTGGLALCGVVDTVVSVALYHDLGNLLAAGVDGNRVAGIHTDGTATSSIVLRSVGA